MSGGHWNYRDQNIEDELNVSDLPKMIEALRKCFHEVDWAISGDTDEKTAGERLYKIIESLGEELFGEHEHEHD